MEDIISNIQDRMELFKILSRFYCIPDTELIRVIREAADSKDSLISILADAIPETSPLEQLKIDYAALFLGPYGILAPPYGSAYFENEKSVMADSTLDAMKWYDDEGLDIAIKEAPDHIVVELEFIYYLIFKQMQAINDSDHEGLVDYVMKQKAFMESHLGSWIPKFARQVGTNAGTDFYRILAGFTESIVNREMFLLSTFKGGNDSSNETHYSAQ
ncbi:MAG: molecular chaperone TorD family protein [Candidatus Hydrogenedentota bacterium]|nr:MAG: molecular chaperone TorD family protein [Candidatus Hydrogenedentota bacterium]